MKKEQTERGKRSVIEILRIVRLVKLPESISRDAEAALLGPSTTQKHVPGQEDQGGGQNGEEAVVEDRVEVAELQSHLPGTL